MSVSRESFANSSRFRLPARRIVQRFEQALDWDSPSSLGSFATSKDSSRSSPRSARDPSSPSSSPSAFPRSRTTDIDGKRSRLARRRMARRRRNGRWRVDPRASWSAATAEDREGATEVERLPISTPSSAPSRRRTWIPSVPPLGASVRKARSSRRQSRTPAPVARRSEATVSKSRGRSSWRARAFLFDRYGSRRRSRSTRHRRWSTLPGRPSAVLSPRLPYSTPLPTSPPPPAPPPSPSHLPPPRRPLLSSSRQATTAISLPRLETNSTP